MKTLTDITNDLMRMDEISVLELLDISSEDLVNRFEDFIELKYETLREQFQEEEDDHDTN